MGEKAKRYEKEWSFDFGKAFNAEVKQASFNAAREDATTADITLEVGVGVLSISALPADSPNLIEVDATYVGEVEFNAEVEGGHGTVRLRQRANNLGSIVNFPNRAQLRWDVRVHPAVATNLKAGTGAGSGQFKLNELRLSGVKINNGAGQINARFPAMNEQYAIHINSGAGEIEATLEDGANVRLSMNVGAGQSTLNIGADSIVEAKLSGGVGQCTVGVPAGAAVRVKASGGISDFSFPEDFVRVSGGKGFFGREGVWETPGFADADRRTKIDYSGGIGELKVRHNFAVV